MCMYTNIWTAQTEPCSWQVSVSASICDIQTDSCARYFGNKSVFLGVESPLEVPSDYTSENSPNKVQYYLTPSIT